MANNVAPGVFSNTIDESFYSAPAAARTIMALFTCFTPRGPDNKITQFVESPKANILRYFGKPKFGKYGQSYHTCLQWAGEGYETAICRLMPSDATYSNICFTYKKSKEELCKLTSAFTYEELSPSKIVNVDTIEKLEPGMKVWIDDTEYEIEDASDTSGSGGTISVTFKEDILVDIANDTPLIHKKKEVISSFIEDARQMVNLRNHMNKALEITDEEVEVPFLLFYPDGRGADYNKLSVQFVLSQDMKDTYKDFLVYTLRVFDKKESGVDYMLLDEEFQLSFYPDAQDINGTNINIADTLRTYSKFLNFDYSDFRIKQVLCDMYNLDIDTATDSEIYTNDIFMGNTDFEDINHNRFKGGSDGSLWNKEGTINFGTKEEIEGGDLNNATNLLLSFYEGTLDPILLDRRWCPTKYIFDNNYPLVVKLAMADLVIGQRNDMRAIIDTGFRTKEEAELAFRNNQFNVDNCNVAIYPNHGILTDKYSGQKITVTSTYNVCKLYARVKNRFGYHYVIGGWNDQGRLDEMQTMAYSPNLEYRNQFTKAQLNTIVSDPDGVFVMENITTQKAASALQQNHIADTLQVIRCETEDFCRKYILTLRITDSTISQVQTEISGNLMKWLDNGACDLIEVVASSSPLQRAQGKVVVQVALRFVNIAKQIELSFVVKGQDG